VGIALLAVLFWIVFGIVLGISIEVNPRLSGPVV
jgi:hypothetical protein